ncbi:MAG: tetratricopeptide repeat protein [Proteobacteria bacterium]|nr:tetratricopeptide repeat protein [Cystobacterineae bacterium]MCL2314962.1 tetratricopeptide repeat protein [Pseudomonadota bacterium]
MYQHKGATWQPCRLCRQRLCPLQRGILWLLALLCTLGLLSCKQRAEQALHQAEAFWVSGDYNKALLHYEVALGALLPEEGCELRSRILKGTADAYYLHADNPLRAIALYTQLVRECPNAPLTQNAHILLAEIQLNHFADLPGAIARLSAVQSQTHEQAEVLVLRIASLYFEAKNYPQAALESKALAYSNAPVAEEALYLHAQSLAMSKETLEEASHAFSELVRRFPDSPLAPQALFELGKLASMDGDEERAIHWWALSLRNHPNPQTVQIAIAAARERLTLKTPDGIGSAERAFDRDKIRDIPQLPRLGPHPHPKTPTPASSSALSTPSTPSIPLTPAAAPTPARAKPLPPKPAP